MELFAAAITSLAGVLTYLTWRNGRWKKLAHKDTQDLIRETRELIKEETRLTYLRQDLEVHITRI